MAAAGTWRRRRLLGCITAGPLITAVASFARGDERGEPLFLGVTTSTENSGLLAHLIDAFEADHDVRIRAVTAGSGAVLNLATRGDVDVVLVHSPADEKVFVETGYGVGRRPVMRNRFVVVGPRSDPARVRTAADAADAFRAIAAKRALFLSRGDESGTHQAELRLWHALNMKPDVTGTGWYRESGSGQGATLNIAVNIGAYTLTDDATWTTFGNPGDLDALYAGDDPSLDNVYSVIRVDPRRHPGLNAGAAAVFADWLASDAGRAAIASFKIDGRALFQPTTDLAG